MTCLPKIAFNWTKELKIVINNTYKIYLGENYNLQNQLIIKRLSWELVSFKY
jgi:hypothetical protein